jgi:tetratricopeptide (TPR) repeat protein
LGGLFLVKKDYIKAEAALLEALEIHKHLASTNPQSYEPMLAATEHNLGSVYYEYDNYHKAEFFLIEALSIREKWMNKYPEVYTKSVSQTATVLLIVYTSILDTLKYDAFKKVKQDNFETVENILGNTIQKDVEVAKKLSTYYGSRSWYLLFASKFNEAEQDARKGLAIDSSYIWIKGNLAHSLLFQGKYREALELYEELKPLKNEEGKSYAAICLED